DVLRKDWNFKGFVSSDWMAGLHDGVKGVNAGLDVEMPLQQHYSQKELQAGLDSGEITKAQIDEIVRRIIRTKLMYVTASNPQTYPKDLPASEAHRELALEVAEKSMVLLKNENNFLPLSRSEIKTLAVIGPLADEENLGDHGSSYTHSPMVITILLGLQDYGEGKYTVVFDDGLNIESAKKSASNADAVVYVVGYAYNDEGEFLPSTKELDYEAWGRGGDRPNLFLKPQDQKLLKEVLPANKNSVVTLIGGSAIMTNDWEELTPSIIMAWYPGIMGGQALANILFGEVNPSGKLPFTIPEEESHLPYFNPRVDSINYGYYHGYTLFDKENIKPAYPFGFGLSYTDFEYDSISLDKTQMGINDTLNVSVQVTNTGTSAGEEVVQLYIGFSNSTVDRPVKLLRGFEKRELAPGETKTIKIPVAARDLARYDPATKQWVVDAMKYELYVGPSSSESDLLKSSFSIVNQL
ncbi:MAG: glycoside hydrolase family 3 C-terminal domain-containing protein, partial [Bacteroidales bacterium]